MSVFTAVLEIQPDGTLHVPVPNDLSHGKVAIHATLEAAETSPTKWQARKTALRQLRASGAIHKAIPDPVGWQREQRHERVEETVDRNDGECRMGIPARPRTLGLPIRW